MPQTNDPSDEQKRVLMVTTLSTISSFLAFTLMGMSGDNKERALEKLDSIFGAVHAALGQPDADPEEKIH